MHYGGISIAFNWRDYLNLATELETGTDEARLRSSISRAYYASYCSSRNYMEDVCNNKLPKTGVSKHKYVIDYYNGVYGGKTNHRRSQIAENLKRMRVERRWADYNNDVHFLKDLHDRAQFVLDLSGDIVELIEKGGF